MTRFYSHATLRAAQGGFEILLDEREVKTPARRPLLLPTEPLARAIAEEWNAQGEKVDLALRGKTLAVVEVKQRATLEAALECVSVDQRTRLRRAGLSIAQRRPGLKDAFVRLDLVALAPRRLPRHIVDAWRNDGHIA